MRRLADKLNIDHHAFIGLAALIVVPAFVWLNYTGFFRNVVATGQHQVKIAVPNAKTLGRNDPVRVKGVDEGLVKTVKPSGDGRSSIVTVSLKKDAGTVYNDATAKVTWRTVLGGSFALNLDPGTPESGKLGSRTLPVSHATTQVELDDVTSVFSGQARTGLQHLPGALSEAMRDPNALPQLATNLNKVAPDVEGGLQAIRGQQKDTDLKTLITETGKTAQALDAPNDQLRTLVEGAAGTVAATAAKQADIRATISGAPATLDETDRTLLDLNHTLDLAQPVVSKLATPAGDVAPTLRKLRPTVEHTDTLLDDAQPLLRKLRPTATSLAAAARQGTPFIDSLEPAVDQFNKQILPYLNATDPETDHTTAEMVGPGISSLSEVAAMMDRNGHILRFPASDGSSPFYGLPCQTYINNPDKEKEIACKSLQQDLDLYTHYNPLQPNPDRPGPSGAGNGG